MASFAGPGSLVELESRDRFGDRIHLALACATVGLAPVNGRLASWFLIALMIWGLIRTVCWRAYLPTGPRRVMIPALCWVGFLALSLAWSSELRTGLYEIWVQPWVALPPLLWPLMSRWRWIVLSALVGTWIQATFQSGAILLDGFHQDGWGWAGFAEHPRRTAVWYAAVVTGLILAIRGRLLSNWLWLLGIIPPLAAILLAGSRAALLALLLSVPAGLLVQAMSRTGGGRVLMKVGAAVLLLVVLVPMANPDMPGVLRETAVRMIDSVDSEQVEDIRIAWWRSSMRQWPRRPMFGYGLGGTATALKNDPILREETAHSPWMRDVAVFNQPHSVYFQTLLEGGLVGVGLLIWLLGTVFQQAWRHSRSHSLGSVAFGGLTVWCVTAAFDQWHAHTDVLAFLWLTATLAAFDPNWLSSTVGSSQVRSAERNAETRADSVPNRSSSGGGLGDREEVDIGTGV